MNIIEIWLQTFGPGILWKSQGSPGRRLRRFEPHEQMKVIINEFRLAGPDECIIEIPFEQAYGGPPPDPTGHSNRWGDLTGFLIILLLLLIMILIGQSTWKEVGKEVDENENSQGFF
ncbi:uncharacterized protein BCR38DRAFT_410820 [Pseudomassariella vexata]|uniref:Uncharacterized protein n=1 Tax=Pseudomassariella vexata TaxID=1141098 RepID=A0A1Y2DT12_9PEZI|nr:uncharacterized protein BCR38DRAFT_410820 [Pseudomassariella vexata]ORY62400.1 hypothetical protein BCR38DRAFT_410820 [Pseudomassariella vexata]